MVYVVEVLELPLVIRLKFDFSSSHHITKDFKSWYSSFPVDV